MAKVIVKKATRRCGSVIVNINYLEGYGTDIKDTEQTYLFKFYGKDNTVPLFTKIGTTAKSCNTRIRQEIGEYRQKGFDVRNVDICKIVQCGSIPAESYESFLRAFLMKDYPDTWRRNDRFFGTDVLTSRFVELCEMYSKI